MAKTKNKHSQELVKVKHLLEQLSKMDPESVFTVNVHQFSKLNKVQINPSFTKGNEYLVIDQSYFGCTLNVWLPGEAYIAKLPKDAKNK